MRGKILFVFFFLAALMGQATAQNLRDKLSKELSNAIKDAKSYDAEKLVRIQRIQGSLADPRYVSLPFQYEIYRNLYDEYKIFRFDSAFLNAKKLTEIAEDMHDISKIVQSRINLLFTLVSAGMYKEASEVVDKIDISGQPDSIKAAYYSLKARYYYDLSDYVNDQFHLPVYYQSGNANLDSALLYYPDNSFEHFYYNGLKNLKSGTLDRAFDDFQTLLQRNNLNFHQQALVISTLSNIFLQQGKKQTAIEYQMRAAIADIKSSTKETFAIYNLAQLLFEEGDFENASFYIEKAIDDAVFYGARQRKVQVSTILPIIQSSRINFIEGERRNWIIYSAALSGILLLLSFLIVTIYRQNRKLQLAQSTISEAHGRLSEANHQMTEANSALQKVNMELHEVNAKLTEANKIKEEYIGYFFNSNSVFFHKLERFKNNIQQKLDHRKIDDIRYIVSKIDIHEEKEELLRNFDKAFLKLFPHFVEEFNALLREEEQIARPDKEVLNTDLRIYALIRLGIKENEKIAEILEYSVKSIYAYKTRIRNKALFTKEEFEKRVMSIKSI